MRLLAALALALTPLALPAQSASSAPLDRLRWLTGCWELRTPTRVTQESWIAPAGGLMLGTSRTVVSGTARAFEFLRIETPTGTVTYVAQPGGGTPTSFPATSVSDTMVVFENPQHDFPQRILYRRVGPDSLLARIEGPQGGQSRGFDFRMQRVDCGG